MTGEKMRNQKLTLNFQQKILIVVSITSIPFVLLSVWVCLYQPPLYQAASLLGILLGAETLIIGITFHKQLKNLEKVNKGRKIFEIEQRE